MSERNGLIFGIQTDAGQGGTDLHASVLFKGCPMACWWCATPEAQSPAPEVMFWKSRCIRCGTCVTTCSLEAAREDMIIEPEVGESAPTVSVSAPSASAASVPVVNAAGYVIERDVCIVCGSCMEQCQGHAREVVGKRLTVSEIMAQLEGASSVTFSGGEPLMQSAFLGELLQECKARGMRTMVETSGYAPWETFDKVRGDVDLFGFDLKLMDDAQHRHFTGVSNEGILHNLINLADYGHPIRLRVPVIPGVTDGEQNLRAIAEFAVQLSHLEGVDLIPYFATANEKYEPLGKAFPLSDPCTTAREQLEAAVNLFDQYPLDVRIVC